MSFSLIYFYKRSEGWQVPRLSMLDEVCVVQMAAHSVYTSPQEQCWSQICLPCPRLKADILSVPQPPSHTYIFTPMHMALWGKQFIKSCLE